MSDSLKGLHTRVVDGFGDVRRAAAGVAAFSRAVWQVAAKPAGDHRHPLEHDKLHVPRAALYRAAREQAALVVRGGDTHDTSEAARLVDIVLDVLSALGQAHVRNEHVLVSPIVCQPIRLARDVIGGTRPDHEVQYFVMLGIREHYRCTPAAQVVHLFNFLADRINAAIAAADRRHTGKARPVLPSAELGPMLCTSLSAARIPAPFRDDAVDLFLECCRAVNYIQVDRRPGMVAAITSSVDAEYLLSRLFGMTTGIAGFDELFGGGLLLIDDFVREPNEWSNGPINGRSVLVTGRYATGKSTLALQVAVEVARKGGAAWFMPLEQSPEECLYTLETMCALPSDGSVIVASDSIQLGRVLRSPGSAGLLVFMRSIKESFEDFLDLLPEHLDLIQHYPFRMIAIDPINAISRTSSDYDGLRRRTLGAFEAAKAKRANIWMNAEEGPGGPAQLYEQNIADVVIRLLVDETQHHIQPYLEVTKSRLQRQQRGRHPYTIVSGRGLTVSPSSVSFADRIGARRLQLSGAPQTFGIPGFNKIVGRHGITAGDVIVLMGPGGLLKTHVGLLFLHSTMKRSDGQLPDRRLMNILIPARDNSAGIRQRLRENFLANQKQEFERYGDVRVCSLPSGYVQPGEVLHRIEQEFQAALLDHRKVERVMVDNVPHWEMACPYVRDDQTFPDTLLSLFRRYGCTSLMTCNNAATSGLQKTIIDNADCVIEFERAHFGGRHRILVRVLKTRAMAHRRETFELVLRENGLELLPDSELLRVRADGQLSPIPVRLFLHAETEAQREYNDDVAASISTVLAPDVRVEDQNRLDMARALAFGTASAVDELQILQLDEFQAALSDPGSSPELYVFPHAEWSEALWNDLDPRLLRRVGATSGRFALVPFYDNLSVLAYHPGRLDGPLQASTWEEIADLCDDVRQRDAGSVVFDFPEVTAENYNCFFFEILLSRWRNAPVEDQCDLEALLGAPEAVEAALLMRRLGAPAHEARRRELKSDARVRTDHSSALRLVALNPGARIWRTWYTTLVQMIETMEPEEARTIVVQPLPAGVSVAGEWYLGIPAYSAAPDVGLRVIKHLTTREAELERLKRGVGLPTRPVMYRDLAPASFVSDTFRLKVEDFGALTARAFRRSSFGCYRHVSGLLGSHLKAILELADGDSCRTEAAHLLQSVCAKLRLVRPRRLCSRCARSVPAGRPATAS